MRLIRLALALVAVSVSWAAVANPAFNNKVQGTINGAAVNGAMSANVGAATMGTNMSATMGAKMGANIGANMGASVVTGQAQARLDGGLGSPKLGSSNSRSSNLTANGSSSGSSPAGAMDESIPRGWLMALVAVLLIGHQLRRKHRFLRPQRFSDL
jgi:hypothetical protein